MEKQQKKLTQIMNEFEKNSLEIALELLEKGEIISFPTDTIYGLAVDATSDLAVKNLYQLKKREASKPIAIFVADLEMAQEILQFNELALKISEEFLPGALTIILPKKSQKKYPISKYLNENDEFLGFRLIEQNFVNSLLQKFKKPLAVTSANISNQEPAKNASEVAKYFINDLNLIIANQKSENSKPSTVLKIEEEKLQIIREGKITKNQIDEFLKTAQ